MNVVVVQAGSGMAAVAPHGTTALVEFAGRSAIEWQLDALPDNAKTTVVVGNRAARAFRHLDVEVAVHDAVDGPHKAILAAPLDDPTLVLFADTLFDSVPECGTEAWIGVGLARGGRQWEFHGPDAYIHRRHLPAARCFAVHAGMYWFADPDRLRAACATRPRAWPQVLASYAVPRDEIVPGWVDIGTPEALASAESALCDSTF